MRRSTNGIGAENLDHRKRGTLDVIEPEFSIDTTATVVRLYWPSSEHRVGEMTLGFFRTLGFTRLYELALCTKIGNPTYLEGLEEGDWTKPFDDPIQISVIEDTGTLFLLPPDEIFPRLGRFCRERLLRLVAVAREKNPSLKLAWLVDGKGGQLKGSLESRACAEHPIKPLQLADWVYD